MTTRILVVLLALLLASPARAQFRPVEAIAVVDAVTGAVICDGPCATLRDALQPTAQPAGREYAPRRMDVVARVAKACPGLILQDHAFTDAVATLLWQEDVRWGRNGKRGNAGDPSHDAIFYKTSASPFGGAVIDIIGSAGSLDASPAWIDQTDATIAGNTTGVWVAPSGRLPACLTGGGGTPTKPPDVPVTPPPTVDLSPVLAKLAAIEARLAAIEARDLSQPIDFTALDALPAYIDDMVGAGPADDPALMPNHVTDIKMRLDVIRTQVEQLNGWLRGRAVLRY